jgi:hypothetical protein
VKNHSLANYFLRGLLLVGILGLPHLVEAQAQYKPGEILVKFKSGVSEAEIDNIVRTYGASIIEHLDKLNVYRTSVSTSVSDRCQ